MPITLSEAIKKSRKDLNELTGLEISSTLGAESEESGWLVTMEAIEKKSIPDSMDILAVYETKLDFEGNMKEFKRVKMRKRIDTEVEN